MAETPSTCRLPLLAAVLVTLALAACDAVRVAAERHPPLRERSLVSWREISIEGSPALAWATARSALIIAGAEEVEVAQDAEHVLLLLGDDQTDWSDEVTGGSAAVIAPDGYCLTASHCLEREPISVLVTGTDGIVRVRPARIVWSGDPDEDGGDLAVIHVDGVNLRPLPWCDGAETRGQLPVLVVGSGMIRPRWAGGAIRSVRAARGEAPPGTLLVETSIPMVPGDSGGPVILASGALLGIAVQVRVGFMWRGPGSLVVRPDPAWVAALVEADRARQSARPTAEGARANPAGVAE